MQTKTIEIRDSMTFIPALAIQVSAADGYLMARAGFLSPVVLLISFTRWQVFCDPTDWGDRTMQAAHMYLAANWDQVADGAVVDVEYILGEKSVPKVSGSVTDPR